MDYNQLVSQIINYANRNPKDVLFNASIPTFIENAQQRIWRESKDIGFELKSTKINLLENQPYIDKPAYWNKTVSMEMIKPMGNEKFESYFLEPRTYEYCISTWPNTSNSNTNNPPLYYCDRPLEESDGQKFEIKATPYANWFISPTPYAKWQIQVTYLAYIQNIKNQNDQNILTLRFPDLLLYSCLCEAFTFTQEMDRFQVFEALYQKALESVNAQTQGRLTDRTSNKQGN